VKLCATCHKTFPDSADKCPEHGDKLKADNLVGTTLGSFTIEGWLGEGGMGVLYRAEHTAIRRRAAVKVLKREFVTDESIAGRFSQEARAIAKIGHPHLIDIFDIGTTPDGRLYYVMELLEGRSLADAMESGRLPFAVFAPILIQACEALEAAHAVGIVHRDLKPDNLFLVERPGEPPFVKVLDFGVAKVLGLDEDVQNKLTRTGNIVGTPQYMAPEQIDGTRIDHRADVYSLGVILYELAAGALPFRADTIGQMLKAHLMQQPAPFDPARLADGVPTVFEAVAMRALSKVADDRYPTVRALREDLQRVLEGQVPEAVAWREKILAEGATVVDQQVPAHLLEAQRALPTVDISRPAPTLAINPKKKSGPVLVGLLAVAVAAVIAIVLWPKKPPVVAAPDMGRSPTVAAPPKRHGPDVAGMKSKALGLLTGYLKDGDPALRKLAVETISSGRDPRHHSLLEPLLDDADTQVRAAVASALGTLGARAATEPLTQAMGKDRNVDVWIAEALDRLGAPLGKTKLKEFLKKGDDAGKLKAALALAAVGDKDARKLLDKQLKKSEKKEPAVAVAIDAHLASGGDVAARKRLAGRLESSDGIARIMVAEALARLGDEAGRAELQRVGADEKAKGRMLALQILSTLDDQSGYDLFRGAFVDAMRPTDERVLGARGLGASGERAALESLAPGLDESEPALRIAAAGAILAIAGADPKALAARSADWAQTALADGSWSVRESAVSVLGDLDAAVAVPLLGKAIHDEQPEVRRAAARSLGRTRAAAAVPILGEALADKKGDVRVVALRSIGQVGKDSGDKSAQAIIAKHLETATAPDEKVVAAASLVKLGDRSHVAELKEGLASADPEIRKLAVEESAVDPETAKSARANALADPSFSVRFAAATQLAGEGNADGVPVLQEAVKKGGADGLAAYGMLQKLGVEPEGKIDPLALLDAGDPMLRVRAVEAGARLEPKKAELFLKRALGDADPRVRMAAVEAAAALPGTPPPGLGLLKSMASDADPAVRARAGALFAKLAPPVVEEEVEAPAAPTPAPKPVAAIPAVVAPDLGEVAAPAPDLSLPAAAAPDMTTAAPEKVAVMAPPPVLPAVPTDGGATPEEPVVDDTPTPGSKDDKQEEARLAMSTGDVYLTAGKYEAAIKELSRAHKLDGKLQVYFALGEAYRKLGDRETDKAKQRDHYGKAIAWYKRARDPKAKSYAAELAERMKE
jgi:serine/threonine-protein kinase